jgi:hypothetical protein
MATESGQGTPKGAEPKEEELMHVALCREADDLRALHRLIGVKVGKDPWVYWECVGDPIVPSAVESLLGACGFGGAPPQAPQVVALNEEAVNGVPLLGFTLSRSEYALVRTAIQMALSGRIGGFVPIVVAQAGFHDTVIDVFSYVWSESNRPPIWLRTPEFSIRGGGDGVPATIVPIALQSTSVRNSALTRGRQV